MCHYNFSTFEICHYNSPILKLTIIILHFFELCYFIRLQGSWTHSQTHVFSYGPKYLCCFSPFNSLTCEAHTSAASSTSNLLRPILYHALLISPPTPPPRRRRGWGEMSSAWWRGGWRRPEV